MCRQSVALHNALEARATRDPETLRRIGVAKEERGIRVLARGRCLGVDNAGEVRREFFVFHATLLHIVARLT